MPSFLSKFVNRERSVERGGNRRDRTASLSEHATSSTYGKSSGSRSSSKVNLGVRHNRVASDTESLGVRGGGSGPGSVNVTVVPPSPMVLNNPELPAEDEEFGFSDQNPSGSQRQRAVSTTAVSTKTTNTTNSSGDSSMAKSASSSVSNLSIKNMITGKKKKESPPELPLREGSTLLSPPVNRSSKNLRHSASDRSLNSVSISIDTTSPSISSHTRSATTPASRMIGTESDNEFGGSDIEIPLTDSPTAIRHNTTFSSPENGHHPSIAHASTFAATPSKDSKRKETKDSGKEKRSKSNTSRTKSPWGRTGSPPAVPRAPTGLASAIAASGLAMAANPMAAQISPPISVSNNVATRRSMNQPAPEPNSMPNGKSTAAKEKEKEKASNQSRITANGSSSNLSAMGAGMGMAGGALLNAPYMQKTASGSAVNAVSVGANESPKASIKAGNAKKRLSGPSSINGSEDGHSYRPRSSLKGRSGTTNDVDYERPPEPGYYSGLDSDDSEMDEEGSENAFHSSEDESHGRRRRRRPHHRNSPYGHLPSTAGRSGSSVYSSEGYSGEEDANIEDIPVTGFAVASRTRNADFHEMFPDVPEGDYLIEDYGCALQREILIQGRLYISENHICFHANIFGWITDLTIPISEIETLEKKMTAFVIPNAIQITTRQAKYSFASFLSRDTTFDVIYNIWRLVKPGVSLPSANSVNGAGGKGVLAASTDGGGGGAVTAGGVANANKKTQCACGREGKHYTETALDTIFPGTVEKIYNLIFASGFFKDFLTVNQKLIGVQISDWQPISPGSNLLTREMSYIKPLNGSIGPKQTKCESKDEAQHMDFDDNVVMITTTRTPDVPSGGVFSVKTRTCIMWASGVSTRVIVTTEVEWTGRSFIKGIIERSAIEGQKTYHDDLDKAIREYISQHSSEFIPEGVDPAALEATPDPTSPTSPTSPSSTKEPLDPIEAGKKREKERNQRAFQWAYDTFDGAYGVAVKSTKGALELVKDAWDQSSSTTILIFVIIILVLSNMYTLVFMKGRTAVLGPSNVVPAPGNVAVPSTTFDEWERARRDRELERQKLVEGVVAALRDEVKGIPTLHGPVTTSPAFEGATSPISPNAGSEPTMFNLKDELAYVLKALDDAETRIMKIREGMKELAGSSQPTSAHEEL